MPKRAEGAGRQVDPLDPWLAPPADPAGPEAPPAPGTWAPAPNEPAPNGPPHPPSAIDPMAADPGRVTVPALVGWIIGLWCAMEVILLTVLVALIQAPDQTMNLLDPNQDVVFDLFRVQQVADMRALIAAWAAACGIGWAGCAIGLWRGHSWARLVGLALAAALAATALTVWPAGAVIVVCAIVAIVLSLSAPVSAFLRASRARRSFY